MLHLIVKRLRNKFFQKFYLFIALLLFSACNNKKEDKILPTDTRVGKITFNFKHHVNNEPLIIDTLTYTNAAGNPYLINEIQYFISDVTLFKADGTEKRIEEWEDIHYIDTDIPETQIWEMYDDISPGSYDSIGFTFGINEEKNESFMYVNPPERDMFWPEYLGGGYHYLKLNGKWEDTTGNIYPFDFHLGIGQIYAGNVIDVDSITGFVHNYFHVSLPNSDFNIENEENKQISIIMNIEKWFQDPHTYDHDTWGGYIMQNQNAMEIAKKNGHNVFSVKIKE